MKKNSDAMRKPARGTKEEIEIYSGILIFSAVSYWDYK